MQHFTAQGWNASDGNNTSNLYALHSVNILVLACSVWPFKNNLSESLYDTLITQAVQHVKKKKTSVGKESV